jgi:hypothetical protein
MNTPRNAAEAIKKGLRRLSDEEIAALDLNTASPTSSEEDKFLCYNGTCANGKRIICYNSGGGCNECFETTEGC